MPQQESEVTAKMKKVKALFEKLFRGIDRTARIAVAVTLSVLAVVSVWAGITMYSSFDDSVRPTLLFRCMDFKLVEDGSIQALVRISAENLPHFVGTAFNIEYNPYFITPAFLETNTEGKEQLTLVTAENSSAHKYFVKDEVLDYIKLSSGKKIDPLAQTPKDGYGDGHGGLYGFTEGTAAATSQTSKPGTISMYMLLDTLSTEIRTSYKPTRTGTSPDYIYDVVQLLNQAGINYWEKNYSGSSAAPYLGPYINASGTVDGKGKDNYSINKDGVGEGRPGQGLNLGSLTFKVDPAHLTEMVTAFNADSDFLIGYSDGTEEDWSITDLTPNPNNNRMWIVNDRKPENPWGVTWPASKCKAEDKAQVVFDFIFPRVFVHAEVAGGSELVVNAYENYGNGTINDIAATLQRYRPEITGTYADAMQENYIFNWGDTSTTGSTPGKYTVYRPAKDGEKADYVDRELGKSWVKLKSSEYDPKSGEYMITQMFYFEEDDEIKEYPLAMEVHLTVTPVELVDVTVDRLYDAYSQTQAQSFTTSSLDALKLPEDALLNLSPVPGPITLKMPIAAKDWTPKTIGDLKTTDTPPKNWSDGGVVNVGDYKIQGPKTADVTKYVRDNYPWITIPDSFSADIVATRTVLPDDDYKDGPTYTVEYVSTDNAGSTPGKLTLRVHKLDENSDPAAFVDDATYTELPLFRTYLPNGTLIDTATGSTTGLPPQGSTLPANGAFSDEQVVLDSTPAKTDVATLAYYPGTNPGRSSHQVDVSRSINLGGWFYVSVCEEVRTPADGGPDEYVWSELMPVYVPPRINYYEPSVESYYNDNAGSSLSGDKYYNFDFTGLSAGLYPFYIDSVLPEHIVLPIGYTVTTTYDGLTGDEPGYLGQFNVNDWAAAQGADTPGLPTPSPAHSADPSKTSPTWGPDIIVDHGFNGDPDAVPPETPNPYAPTDFMDMTYGGYGAVENHLATHIVGEKKYSGGKEQVHMRVQTAVVPTPSPTPEPTPTPSESPDPSETPGPTDTPGPSDTPKPDPTPEPKPEEKILLIHEDSIYTSDNKSGITRSGPDNEVKEITYTLQQEGYVVRETFTLTIVNNGTEDIYGLSVDVINGTHSPAFSSTHPIPNHFEVTKPPAAYIKGNGGKTQFEITYVYNLKDIDGSKKATPYEDHILITSNGYDKDNPLKDFIANFEVSKDDIYTVTLEVLTDPSTPPVYMGTASIIKGLPQGSDPTAASKPTPDLDSATNKYVADHEYVWIHPEPIDEYAVKEVYWTDGTLKIPLSEYNWTGDGGGSAHYLKMPDKDITVTVVLYEPIMSKLRLSRLMGYAGTTVDIGADVKGASLISDDRRHNIRWYDDTSKIIQTTNLPEFVDTVDGQLNMSYDDSSRPKRPDYVMVLGDYTSGTPLAATDDLAYVQLQARLRGAYALTPDVDPVSVEFYEYDLTTGQRKVPNNSFLNTTPNTTPETGYTQNHTSPLVTNAPTTHNTIVFDAPPIPENADEVSKMAVEITLSTKVTADMQKYPDCKDLALGDTISRKFVVVIIRPAKGTVTQLGYGNSPKGMIYNNTPWSDTQKAANWEAFKKNNYRFASTGTPQKATTYKLTNTYWKEAWGGLGYNGDEDEYALFVILGKSFQDPGFIKLQNSAGLDVKEKDITRSAVVELLDNTATTQAGRFEGQKTGSTVDTVTLDLGTGDKGLVTSTVAGDEIKDWWQEKDADGKVTKDYAIRPGVYKIVYTFTDYDGVTVKTAERPFIVLSAVGDVNADKSVNNTKADKDNDADYIKNRMADPLGGMQTPYAGASGAEPDYPAWRLFRYRCCDTNNDRNLNNIDANRVQNGKDSIVAYYQPTDYVYKK